MGGNMSKLRQSIAVGAIAGATVFVPQAAVADSIDYPPPPPPTLQLTASASCVGDVPMLSYTATVDGQATGTTATVTIQETTTGGRTYEVGSGLPLSGSFPWPGYSATPEAWPGWSQSGGVWTDGGDDVNLGWTRDAFLVVEVNPTATVAIQYPAATAACMPTSGEFDVEGQSTTSQVTTTEVDATVTSAEEQLPATGFDSMPIVIGAGLLLAAGAGAVVISGRRGRSKTTSSS